MSKIIATCNSHLSSAQPVPLCPTSKSQSASHSGVRQFMIPWIVAQPASSVHGILQARILEWVADSFPRGSSPPRTRTWVSHIAGRLFTNWATRETCPTSAASQFSCVLQEFRRFVSLILSSVSTTFCLNLFTSLYHFYSLVYFSASPQHSALKFHLSLFSVGYL